MNPQLTMILAVAAMLFVVFIFAGIWASRFVKVAPNQVLIVSGRTIHLPDGRSVGYRIVKGGGTFVFPVIERVDVLSLEAFTVEMPESKAQAAGGHAVRADCIAQVKIGGDDASLVAATEHFLSKSPPEIANSVRPILEKHLSNALASTSLESASQNPAACAALVQTAAGGELGRMRLSILGFSIRNIRAA
jgi:flotillin